MPTGIRAYAEPVRELDFGSISGTYAALGSGFSDNIRIVCFNNSTDAEIYISLDGNNNHFRLAANSFRLYDLTTNSVPDSGLFFAQHLVLYAKQVSAAPTTGTVWMEAVFAQGGR